MSEKLIDRSRILEMAKSVESGHSIYFLILDNEIVYVGQSKNPVARIKNHQQNKDFDSVTIIPCSEDGIDDLEADYILSLSPILNRGLPKNNKYTSWAKLKEETGLGHWELRKWANDRHIRAIPNSLLITQKIYSISDFAELIEVAA